MLFVLMCVFVCELYCCVMCVRFVCVKCCVLCLCLCDSFTVFACGVCGILCDDVWCVVLFYVIVVCVLSFMCSWVLFVIYCVVMYGMVSCV